MKTETLSESVHLQECFSSLDSLEEIFPFCMYNQNVEKTLKKVNNSFDSKQ